MRFLLMLIITPNCLLLRSFTRALERHNNSELEMSLVSAWIRLKELSGLTLLTTSELYFDNILFNVWLNYY